MTKINKNSKEYKQGFIDGFANGMKATKKTYRQSQKNMKPIREAINKLRSLRSL